MFRTPVQKIKAHEILITGLKKIYWHFCEKIWKIVNFQKKKISKFFFSKSKWKFKILCALTLRNILKIIILKFERVLMILHWVLFSRSQKVTFLSNKGLKFHRRMHLDRKRKMENAITLATVGISRQTKNWDTLWDLFYMKIQ